MKLYLLTNEFRYSDPEDPAERVGIFDSTEAVKKAKEDYMAMMPSLPRDTFRFHVEEFELNKIH